MYAVIFKADIAVLDESYTKTAERMRQLALSKYGCLEFSAVSDETSEIAISYWENEQDIARWKQDPEHIDAQSTGKSDWYKRYSVEVVEIKRQYQFDSQSDLSE